MNTDEYNTYISYDVENQKSRPTFGVENQKSRPSSGKRGIRYIPEVTADNLPSKIRLEIRNVGKDGKVASLLSVPTSSAQASGNKIVSDVITDQLSMKILLNMMTSNF